MRINKIFIYIIVVVLGTFTACTEKFIELDKEPQNKISGAAVFKDKQLAESNLAQIYEQTLFAYRDINAPVWDLIDEGMGAVARGFAYWQVSADFPMEVIDKNGAGPMDY